MVRSALTGLYIHIPFCVSKCPYCGFYSAVSASEELKDDYLSACIEELKGAPRSKFDTLYVGGGTPSVLGAKRFCNFVKALFQTADFSSLKEFTVEVNPESAGADFARVLGTLPVTRVSVGVQSLNDSVLKLLGRAHTAKQAEKAFLTLRKYAAGAALNGDIIYDIPAADWSVTEKSLKGIIELNPEHISAYSYSPDTGYLTRQAAESPKEMRLAIGVLKRAGYRQYEVSNFARKGYESLHNLNYWSMEYGGGEYVGVGASSHSMLYEKGQRVRYSRAKNIAEYIKNPLKLDSVELYDEFTLFKENVVIGLRKTAGVDLKRDAEGIPSELYIKIEKLLEQGLLIWRKNRLKTTRKGLYLLDSVTSYLW